MRLRFLSLGFVFLLSSSVPMLAQYGDPPPEPQAAPVYTIFFAQIGNGGGFTSSIVLTNPSQRDIATGTVEFVGDQGIPLKLGIAGDVAKTSASFRIRPLGSVIIETDGIDVNASAGSAVVKSDKVVSGVVVFTAGPAAGGLGSAGVGESVPAPNCIVPVRRSAESQINSGVALANTSDLPANVELSLRSMEGQEVSNGRTSVVLAAHGHRAQFLDQLFPQADTSNFVGTLVVTSNQPVAATALSLRLSEPKSFTALPVAPLLR
jgi:hypothetical protein